MNYFFLYILSIIFLCIKSEERIKNNLTKTLANDIQIKDYYIVSENKENKMPFRIQTLSEVDNFDEIFQNELDQRDKRARDNVEDRYRVYQKENCKSPYAKVKDWPASEGAQEKLDRLTSKIWRSPASLQVQQAWIHPFCLRYTSIGAEFKKTWDNCQFMGVDWGCVYATLGDKGGGFSMTAITEMFSKIADIPLRSRLLDGITRCNIYWDNYRYEEARRILAHEIKSEVEYRTKTKSREALLKTRNYRQINLERIKELRLQKFQETQKKKLLDKERIEKVKTRLEELRTRGRLSDKEREELQNLMLPEATSTQRYSLLGVNLDREERIEMALKDELGACIAQEVVSACEPKIKNEIKKLL